MRIYHEGMETSGRFLHILDPTELFRVVQSAGAVAKTGKAVTPMMALDYYRIQRVRYVVDAGYPDIDDVLFRINCEPSDQAQD
jgi:hypothetical protein